MYYKGMKTFKEFLAEKLITFGGQAYPKFNQVVVLSGGAGSGKGFTIEHLLGIQGMTFDVDQLKKMATQSMVIRKNIRDKFGVDISDFDLRNPDNVAALHDLLADKSELIDRHQRAKFSAIMQAPADRKPNLIFDVTLKDVRKLQKISNNVRQLGYDIDNIHIVWVVNDFRVAMQQNQERDRRVPEDILLDTHVGAGITMKALLDGTYSLKNYMDGDFWISLNKRGVDSTVKTSDQGGKYVSDSNYFKIKSKNQQVIPIESLQKKTLAAIAEYVPQLANWNSVLK